MDCRTGGGVRRETAREDPDFVLQQALLVNVYIFKRSTLQAFLLRFLKDISLSNRLEGVILSPGSMPMNEYGRGVGEGDGAERGGSEGTGEHVRFLTTFCGRKKARTEVCKSGEDTASQKRISTIKFHTPACFFFEL